MKNILEAGSSPDRLRNRRGRLQFAISSAFVPFRVSHFRLFFLLSNSFPFPHLYSLSGFQPRRSRPLPATRDGSSVSSGSPPPSASAALDTLTISSLKLPRSLPRYFLFVTSLVKTAHLVISPLLHYLPDFSLYLAFIFFKNKNPKSSLPRG